MPGTRESGIRGRAVRRPGAGDVRAKAERTGRTGAGGTRVGGTAARAGVRKPRRSERPRLRGGRTAEGQVLAARGAPARHRRRPARPGSEGGQDPTGAAGRGGGSSVSHLGPQQQQRRLGGPEQALGVSWLSESLGRAGNAPGNTRPPPLPPGAGALPARPLPPGAPPSELGRGPVCSLCSLPSRPPPPGSPPGHARPTPVSGKTPERGWPRFPPAAEGVPQGGEAPRVTCCFMRPQLCLGPRGEEGGRETSEGLPRGSRPALGVKGTGIFTLFPGLHGVCAVGGMNPGRAGRAPHHQGGGAHTCAPRDGPQQGAGGRVRQVQATRA